MLNVWNLRKNIILIAVLLLTLCFCIIFGQLYPNTKKKVAISSAVADEVQKKREIWPMARDIRHLRFLGCLVYGSPMIKPLKIEKIEIVPNIIQEDTGWFGETFKLKISLDDGSLIEHPFYAALGFFLATVPEYLWGARYQYIILIGQASKGTGIIDDELNVYEIEAGALRRVLRRKVSGIFDMWGNSWSYRVFNAPTRLPGEPGSPGYPALELRIEKDFVRKDKIPKDADYGAEMPKVICIIYRNGNVHEFKDKNCSEVEEIE